MGTKIEWAERTVNWIVGCSKCSPGCLNCYAERMANRLSGMEIKRIGEEARTCGKYTPVIDGGSWNGNTIFSYEKLPKKPSIIFVSSMGDFFHESVTESMHHTALQEMCDNQQHTYILLTKRAGRMRDFINTHILPRRIWCGVTVCNQEEADEKIPILLEAHARVKFVSIEPMLEPIDLSGHVKNLQWVIVGGESGPGARPLNPDWIRLIRDQCADAGVPFMFKQWGEYCYPDQMPEETFSRVDAAVNLATGAYKDCYRVGKKHSGRTLDGKIHDEYPIVQI